MHKRPEKLEFVRHSYGLPKALSAVQNQALGHRLSRGLSLKKACIFLGHFITICSSNTLWCCSHVFFLGGAPQAFFRPVFNTDSSPYVDVWVRLSSAVLYRPVAASVIQRCLIKAVFMLHLTLCAGTGQESSRFTDSVGRPQD